jgi:hypothetical protein
MTAPYFDDGTVQLYLGDMREIIPELGLTADLIVADPPLRRDIAEVGPVARRLGAGRHRGREVHVVLRIHAHVRRALG